jgi:hypothetical protein
MSLIYRAVPGYRIACMVSFIHSNTVEIVSTQSGPNKRNSTRVNKSLSIPYSFGLFCHMPSTAPPGTTRRPSMGRPTPTSDALVPARKTPTRGDTFSTSPYLSGNLEWNWMRARKSSLVSCTRVWRSIGVVHPVLVSCDHLWLMVDRTLL